MFLRGRSALQHIASAVIRGNALCTLEGFSPPQKEEGCLACATMQGRSPLARWRVLWQERECECIAAHCQHINEGQFSLACWRSPQPVKWGRSTVQHVASAAIQRQLIVVYVLLNFWIFSNFEKFPILVICC